MKLLKGNPLYSVFTGTCPVCQQESMYVNKNPFKLSSVIKMRERCSHCHTKYQIEPSFFYGAMYVSYAVGVAIGIAAFIIAFIFFKMGPLPSFFFITGSILISYPIILRLSRNIWINFFLHYDPSKVKQSA